MPKDSLNLPDLTQSAWQLAAIQLSGWISLPILATSIFILQVNSFLGSILTIIVGNAIIWFLRLGIISMSHQKRQSTLDISAEYTGIIGKYFIAILLLLSTLSWFIAQTYSGSDSITSLFHIKESKDIDQFIQISVFLGIASTFFCMGGMPLLRKLSTFSLPLLVLGFLIIFYLLPDRSPQENGRPLSLAGLTLVLTTNLGITADLPTFFRHSRSWKDSIIALTTVQVISLALGILSLYFGSILSKGFEIDHEAIHLVNSSTFRLTLVAFIFLSVICANVANVYSASVGWEILAPKALVGRKEYLILGLSLTTIFILVSDLFYPEYLLHISDSLLVNLSMVLLIGHMITRYRKSPPTLFEQSTYFVAWFLASLINILQLSNLILIPLPTVLISIAIISLVVSLSFLRHLFRIAL